MSERRLSKWLKEQGLIARLDENDEWIVEIGINDHEIDKEVFSRVSEIQNLQTLDIGHDQFTDSDLEAISDHPTLKTLYLTGQRMTGKGLLPIKKLPVLSKLHAELLEHGDVGLNIIGEVTTLEDLSLTCSFGISDAGMPALSHLSRLKNLYMMCCPISRGVEVVAQFPLLESLVAERTLIRDESLEAISMCKNLRILNLPDGFSDEGICKLASLKKLDFLSFGGAITEKSIKVLSTLPNLNKVFFNEPLAPEVLLRLSELNQIVRLGVTKGDFQTPEFKRMKRKNAHVHYTTRIDLSDKEIPGFQNWLKSQGLPSEKFDDWLRKKEQANHARKPAS